MSTVKSVVSFVGKCDSLIDIEFSWNYTAATELSGSTPDDLVADIKQLFVMWDEGNSAPLCMDDDDCTNGDFVLFIDNHPSVLVTIKIFGAS